MTKRIDLGGINSLLISETPDGITIQRRIDTWGNGCYEDITIFELNVLSGTEMYEMWRAVLYA